MVISRSLGWVWNLCDDGAGSTAVEYALLLAGILLVIVTAVVAFGSAVRGLFELVPPL